ncbi:MAG: thiol peroxidase [Pirellulaceae bacterium]
MTEILFKGNPIHTNGSLPAAGTKAPDFKLVAADLSEKTLADYSGKVLVLNIFPSIDTGVCAASVRQFNERAASNSGVEVLNISLDLPFAQKRFCGAEGLEGVHTLSGFRCDSFGKNYGVTMTDGPLAGLYSRAVVVVDGNGQVVYVEQVPEITQEPNYDSALTAAGA